MEIAELSHLVSLSMSYQAYLQELNARNMRLAESGQKSVLQLSFSELLEQVNVAETSSAGWRQVLEAETTITPGALALDEISLAVSRNAGSYRTLSEGYSRVLSLYRTSLGKG